MASFSAELHVSGQVFRLRQCTYQTEQAVDARGRTVAKVRFGLVALVLDVPESDALLAWAANLHKRLAVDIVFRNAMGGSPLETLHLSGAYCVAYAEEFVHGDAAAGAYVAYLTLSDPDGFTLLSGGPTAGFVSPAAQEYAYVPASAAAVVQAARIGADGAPDNPMDPKRMALWMGYLERRGIQFLIGTPEAELKLHDFQAEGFYSGGHAHKTIFLRNPPGTATFFEEAFHALQDLHNHPLLKTLADGQEVDAWEYDAKQALLKHSEKLGLSYEEHLETEAQLEQVINNEYGNF